VRTIHAVSRSSSNGKASGVIEHRVGRLAGRELALDRIEEADELDAAALRCSRKRIPESSLD
jgi:hypothetical protein